MLTSHIVEYHPKINRAVISDTLVDKFSKISNAEEFGNLLRKEIDPLESMNLTILYFDNNFDFIPEQPVFRFLSPHTAEMVQSYIPYLHNNSIKRKFRISKSNIFTKILREGKMLFIPNRDASGINKFDYDLLTLTHTGSNLFVPLQYNDHIFGYTLFWTYEDEESMHYDENKFNLIATLPDIAIQNLFLDFIQKHSKISHERFQQYFFNSNDLMIILKSNGLILEINDQLFPLLGYEIDELLGEHISKIISPDENLDNLSKLTNNRTILSFKSKSREIILFEITSFSTFEFGNDAMYIWQCRDQKERQLFLNKMIQSEKTRSLSILSGGLAHDFNNYLSAIEANTSLLEYTLTEHMTHNVNEILKNIHQIVANSQRLTKQLLTYSTGGTLDLQPTNIEKLIAESLEFTLSGSNIVSSLTTNSRKPYVLGDKGMLSQVFTNLILNSRDALVDVENKRILVNIADLKDERLEIAIKDNGIGLYEDDMSRIFDPFYSTKQKGTGLGLSTSLSIIKEHKGEITVISQKGKYTQFTITLPKYTGNLDQTLPKRKDVTITGNYHIWLMDDVEEVTKSLSKLLTIHGQDVKTFTEGQSLINELEGTELQPDIYILDLTNKLGLGGSKVLEYLQGHNIIKPIILISGYASNFRDMAVLSSHNIQFLTKPIAEHDLVHAINELLNKLNM